MKAEVGRKAEVSVLLMTIIACKENENWKWISLTNQRTKKFFTNPGKSINNNSAF
jgi:hypothetical protein